MWGQKKECKVSWGKHAAVGRSASRSSVGTSTDSRQFASVWHGPAASSLNTNLASMLSSHSLVAEQTSLRRHIETCWGYGHGNAQCRGWPQAQSFASTLSCEVGRFIVTQTTSAKLWKRGPPRCGDGTHHLRSPGALQYNGLTIRKYSHMWHCGSSVRPIVWPRMVLQFLTWCLWRYIKHH